MKRTWVPTALILVLAASAAAAAAPAPKDSLAGGHVDAMSALRAAASTPAAKFAELQTGRYATVYNEGGKRFAVIDQTVKGAPQGALVIDGVAMADLGLDYIDVIQMGSVVTDQPSAGQAAPALLGNGAPVIAPNGTIGAQSLKDWHDDWTWRRDTSSGIDRMESEGELAFGCENGSDDEIVVDCTLTTEATYTIGGSFNLSYDKVANLGFNIGHTDRRSIALTMKTLKPHSLYYLQPMVERNNRYWLEQQRHWQCTRAWNWFSCVAGTTRQIHTHDDNGEAHKAKLLYGRLMRQQMD